MTFEQRRPVRICRTITVSAGPWHLRVEMSDGQVLAWRNLDSATEKRLAEALEASDLPYTDASRLTEETVRELAFPIAGVPQESPT